MKQMMWGARGLVAALVCAACGMVGAADFSIQSFNSTGQLTFNEISTATVYRVEWAPTPSGPWTNFSGAAIQLDMIQATGSGIVTCSVPICYRVVAMVTNAPPAMPPGMVVIPAGTNIGTDPDFGAYALTNEAAFYMDATEVTKDKWDEVYSWAVTNGYTFVNAGSGKAANHPVHTVSWYDCVTWCNARSAKEGKTPCYNLSDWSCNFSATGYRLPTIIEWEYAARGGLSGKRFPGGDIINHAWANYFGYPASYMYDQGYQGFDTRYAIGEYPYTSPAGMFAVNGYGLYDMAGNVWEWCNDSSGLGRYICGGSWGHYASDARCRNSIFHSPEFASYGNGFRAVCR